MPENTREPSSLLQKTYHALRCQEVSLLQRSDISKEFFMIRSVPVISTVLVCLLSFFMFGCGEAEDLVEIPDDALRTQIKQELNLREDASITKADMLRLTELHASRDGFDDFFELFSEDSTRISDLTGLQYAENLVVLDLDNNSIVDISLLAGLTSLSELHLDDNNIIDINPLAGLINLTELNLNDNAIVNVIPLAGLKSLTWLNLRGNAIVDISPLAGLKNLQELDIRGNLLSVDSQKRIIPILEANGTAVMANGTAVSY